MFSISKQQTLLAAVILATSTGAVAKDISYDFIQGTYNSVDIDNGPDGDGLGISGSFSITPHIAFSAGYSSTDFDLFNGNDVDINEFNFGLTAHTSVAPGTDVFGNFSIVKAEIERSNIFFTDEEDDTGNAITLGLRHMASQQVELDLNFSRVDVFDDAETAIGFGARFYASNKLSLGIAYATGDDVDTLSFSVRYDFK